MKKITALISSMNRSEYLENTIEKCLKINHCFTYRDIGLVEYIICKFIFLKTFFKIYFRHEKIIYFSVLKRALNSKGCPLTDVTSVSNQVSLLLKLIS